MKNYANLMDWRENNVTIGQYVVNLTAPDCRPNDVGSINTPFKGQSQLIILRPF
jgi:hypothetical protein